MKGIKEKQEKRIIYLAVLFFAVVIVALFVLSQTFFVKEENIETAFVPQQRFIDKNINIDFNVLKNAFFDEIQEFEKISYPEIEFGRENPFLSY